MMVSVRSYLSAGVAVVGASVIAVSASIQAPPEPVATQAVQLTAAVQPLVQVTDAASALLGAVKNPVVPDPSQAVLGAAVATVGATQSIGGTIIAAYNAVEPWVAYGFNLTAWGLSWVIGPLASQLYPIAYDFGESFVRSWVYSFAYLLDGNFGAIVPELINGATSAFTGLVQNEINWVLGFLPPLPPIPPFSATQAASLTADVTSAQQPGVRAPAQVLQALGQGLGRGGPLTEVPTSDGTQAVLTQTERTPNVVVTDTAAIPARITKAAQGFTEAAQANEPTRVAAVPDLNPTNAPPLKAVVGAPPKAADTVRNAQRPASGALAGTSPDLSRSGIKATPTTVAQDVHDTSANVAGTTNSAGSKKADDNVKKAADAPKPHQASKADKKSGAQN